MVYGVWSKMKIYSYPSFSKKSIRFDSIPISLTFYCKVRKANFTSFPSNSPGKARAVFKLYLGVKSKLIKTDYGYID